MKVITAGGEALDYQCERYTGQPVPLGHMLFVVMWEGEVDGLYVGTRPDEIQGYLMDAGKLGAMVSAFKPTGFREPVLWR